VRKWIYDLPVTEDIDALIEQMVDAFLNGGPHVLAQVDNDIGGTPRLS
jgi:hypothetical protein